MAKATLGILLAMTCAGLGNLCLAKGMRGIGDLPSWELAVLWNYFFRAFTDPWVLLGVLLELAYFVCWLAVLSWAEVSWAVPMNAVEYLFVALLAVFLLGEKVAWSRWVGIFFISAGVLFLLRSWKGKESQREKVCAGV